MQKMILKDTPLKIVEDKGLISIIDYLKIKGANTGKIAPFFIDENLDN